jgi:hypothetical protein
MRKVRGGFMGVPKKAYGLYVMAALCIVTCYGADKKAILNEILTNPTKILETNRILYHQFSRETNPHHSGPITYTQEQALIQKYETKNPFFMLTECDCPLISRTKNPKYRAAFENAIFTEYNQKLKRKNPITCISFASGGGFQDLVILCKILNQNPYAMINLHMIDPEYQHYIRKKEGLDLPRLISLDQETMLYQKPELYTRTGYRYQQMLKFLEEVFPNAHVRLYSHETMDHFFVFAKKFNIIQDIDLIYTADIDNYRKAVLNYKRLCIRVLEVNKNVINIDLSKAFFPYLLRFSLTPFDKGSSEKITVDNKIITLYYATYSIDWLTKEVNRKIGQFNRAIASFLQKIRNRFR